MQDRILVIDDEKLICAMLKEFLEGRGFEVSTASDVYSAIRELKEFAPDVVLLDLKMPDVDGLELLQIIRRTMKGKDVIIITGDVNETVARKAMEEGALSYVLKPIDFSYLLRVLLTRSAMCQ